MYLLACSCEGYRLAPRHGAIVRLQLLRWRLRHRLRGGRPFEGAGFVSSDFLAGLHALCHHDSVYHAVVRQYLLDRGRGGGAFEGLVLISVPILRGRDFDDRQLGCVLFIRLFFLYVKQKFHDN